MKLLLSILVTIVSFAVALSAESVERTVAGSPEDIRPLLIGEEIPDVTLGDLDGNPVNLRDILAEKPTILIYYRGGW